MDQGPRIMEPCVKYRGFSCCEGASLGRYPSFLLSVVIFLLIHWFDTLLSASFRPTLFQTFFYLHHDYQQDNLFSTSIITLTYILTMYKYYTLALTALAALANKATATCNPVEESKLLCMSLVYC